MIHRSRKWACAAALVALAAGSCGADEAAAKPAGFPVHVGVDAYLGASQQPANRTYSDGFWGGAGPSLPSVAYVRAETGALAAKVSFGIGKLTTLHNAPFHQPIEAWVQGKLGQFTLTAGKFWIPLASLEWETETKPGLMAQWTTGNTTLTAASTYCADTRAANTYARVSQRVCGDLEVGISAGSGRGILSSTTHDRVLGAHLNAGWRKWRATSEWLLAERHASDRFWFGFGRLAWEGSPVWQPYVAAYAWNDRTDQLGRFRSTVYGVTCKLTPTLSIDAATSPTSARGMSWAQLHWTWEK